MLINNNNCSTPPNNLIYESESCENSQGRDLKNATSTSASGVTIFDSKKNDYLLFRPLTSPDLSIGITFNPATKLIELTAGGGGHLTSVTDEGSGIVDNTDPLNPIIDYEHFMYLTVGT